MVASNDTGRSMRLLLDEAITRRCFITLQTDLDIRHTVDIQELGWGAKDDKIVRYLLTHDYGMFVTPDQALIKECIRLDIKVAWYERGRVYSVVSDSRAVEIGTHSTMARAVPPRGGIVGVILDLRRVMRRVVRRNWRRAECKLRRLLGLPSPSRLRRQRRRAGKCQVCGMQWHDALLLQNHLQYVHRL